MPTGDIIRRETIIRPDLKLGLGMKSFEPFLKFVMDTAAETKTITEEYRDAQRRTNELLEELLVEVRRPASMEKPT